VPVAELTAKSAKKNAKSAKNTRDFLALLAFFLASWRLS